MAHKIAKLLLEQADSFLDRTDAVKTALSMGMSLREIEEYLDWLEASGMQQAKKPGEVDSRSTGKNGPRQTEPRKVGPRKAGLVAAVRSIRFGRG